MPTVSIGLPVRNGLPFVRTALDSLLAQTYADFELIISDNASDDGTADVCAEYASRDSRIRLIRNEQNIGGAANFNRAFQESRGRYFKWAAADDVCLPTFLERCVDVVNDSPRVVLCYPKTQLIDAQGRRIEECQDNMHIDNASAMWRFRYVLRNYIWANPIFGLLRADVVRKTQLHGAYPGSDSVLAAEIALQGQFHELPDLLFLRRVHDDQSMKAYKTMRERASWFHPNRAGGRVFPGWRLVGEHIRAVRRAPLSSLNRCGCQLQIPFLVLRGRERLWDEVLYGCSLLPGLLKPLGSRDAEGTVFTNTAAAKRR